MDDVLAELDPGIEQLAQDRAKDCGVSAAGAGDIARLANRTLRSPAVVAGLRAPQLWSEIPVAATIDTPRVAPSSWKASSTCCTVIMTANW